LEEISYIERGNGQNCLFLIHGFCSGPEDWIHQINFFSQYFTVLAPTLRGHDGNNVNNRPMSIEQLSNDCINIIENRKFKKIILAGHSMGTRVAIDMASKIKNLNGLILVDGSRFSNFENYFDELSAFEKSLKNSDYESILRKMFSSMFFSVKFENDKKRIVDRAINVPIDYSITLRRNTIWYDSHCVENYVKNLNTPILLLHSTKIDKENGRITINNKDDVPYIDFIKFWTDQITINKFEKTGHYITIEEPDIVNEQIIEWLEKLKLHFRQ